MPPKPQVAGTEVGEQVPAEKQHLKRQHGRVPHRRAPSEDREERSGNERLDDEKQRGAHERRDAEEDGDATRFLRSATLDELGEIAVGDLGRLRRPHVPSSTEVCAALRRAYRGRERTRPSDWRRVERRLVTGSARGAGGGWVTGGGHPGGRHGAECCAVELSTSTSRVQLSSNVHGGLQLTTRQTMGP